MKKSTWGWIVGAAAVGLGTLAWMFTSKARAQEGPMLMNGHTFSWPIGPGLSKDDAVGLQSWADGNGRADVLQATAECFNGSGEYIGSELKDLGDGTFDVLLNFKYTGIAIDTNTLQACLGSKL